MSHELFKLLDCRFPQSIFTKNKNADEKIKVRQF